MIKHAANILRAFEIEPKPADRLVDLYFRRNRNLGSRDRRIIADSVFGVLRWKRRLEGYLRREGVNRAGCDQLVSTYVAWQQKEVAGRLENIPVDISFTVDDYRKFPGGGAAYYSFPDFLYEMLIKEYGSEDALKIMGELNEPAENPTIRVNLLKTDYRTLYDELVSAGIDVEKTQMSPYGMKLKERTNFGSLESYRLGKFEVQDEASQLASLMANAKPGETVLDACAGAGGKSIFLAMMMENKGKIIATDKDERKLKELRKRAARAGASCVKVIPPTRFKELESYRGLCDLVVIDAPCSGTGTLKRNPDLKWRLSEDMIRSYVDTQSSLLGEYSAWLKPNGRLLYITCSILSDENEKIIERFVKSHPFNLVENPQIQIQKDKKSAQNIFTGEGYLKTAGMLGFMDGFFACIMKRVG